MLVIGLNGSPRYNGNTVSLIKRIFQGAEQKAHHCELIHLRDYQLDYCTWCFKCIEDGVCKNSDRFHDLLDIIKRADVIIIGSPSSGHSVTGYMKNWLDRFCNSQLIFDVDKNNKVHKKSRLSSGIKAIIVVTGCTGNLTSTVEPIEAVLSSMSIPILNRLIIPNIRLDEHYSISNDTHLMQQAYEIGIHL